MPEYTITATDSTGKDLTVKTETRATAIRYSSYFRSNSEFIRVSVTVGDRVYLDDQIRNIP